MLQILQLMDQVVRNQKALTIQLIQNLLRNCYLTSFFIFV